MYYIFIYTNYQNPMHIIVFSTFQVSLDIFQVLNIYTGLMATV